MNKEQEQQVEQLRNVWAIGEKIGDPASLKMQVHDLVLLEMKSLTSFEVAMPVANAAANWIESGDPYYINYAIVICHEFQIVPPSSLQKEIYQVAKKRLNGEIVVDKSKSIVAKAATNSTLMFIANLIHSGDTLTAACSKGATWRAQKYSTLRSMKASTLESYYTKEWRKKKSRGKSFEKIHFEKWDKCKSSEDKTIWSRIRELIPEASPELKGERR